MAGEIRLNSTTMATESLGSITLSNVDSATNRTNLGLGSMATQNANAVAITGGTINTVQPATGQSLTIKDEDGNTAITIGTDNTVAGYLSLNFGSYHGGSGTQTGSTLSDYETGIWSPSYTNLTTTGTVTHSGTYTKIGNLVYITATVTRVSGDVSTTGSSTNINNPPFSVSTTQALGGAARVGNINSPGGSVMSNSGGGSLWLPTISATPQSLTFAALYFTT